MLKKIYTNSGQSLLELVMLTGVVVTIITALTIIVISGLKNSQFSANQTQATKLAQDGLERIRTIKNRNWTVCIADAFGTGSNIAAWNDLFNDDGTKRYFFGKRNDTSGLAACKSPGCAYVLRTAASNCAIVGSRNTDYWINPATTAIPAESILNDTFKRVIYLEDPSDVADVNKQIKVTSKVTWIDSEGEHVSELTTSFSR